VVGQYSDSLYNAIVLLQPWTHHGPSFATHLFVVLFRKILPIIYSMSEHIASPVLQIRMRGGGGGGGGRGEGRERRVSSSSA